VGWLMAGNFLWLVGSFGFHLEGILVSYAVNRVRYLMDFDPGGRFLVLCGLERRAGTSLQ
jgi:hypothetical protein